MKKFDIALAALLVGSWLLAPHAAQAQDAWPSKPVRMIVPFAPGGPTDATSCDPVCDHLA